MERFILGAMRFVGNCITLLLETLFWSLVLTVLWYLGCQLFNSPAGFWISFRVIFWVLLAVEIAVKFVKSLGDMGPPNIPPGMYFPR